MTMSESHMMSELGRSLVPPRSEPVSVPEGPGNRKSGAGGHLATVRASVAGLDQAEAEKVMAAVGGMRDYYQYHIRKLKDLVRDRQAHLEAIEAANASLREENAVLRLAERDQAAAAEEFRLQAIEKDKEVGRLRVLVEEEKSKLFQRRRAEQDWLDDVDKLRREINSLRELTSIKEEEISYLKKTLRGIEDEAMDLRDQKRELLARVERLQAQPIADEKSQIERSSKYLVEQINSLKRELYKAKAVVENYKVDRESERQESLQRHQRRRNSQPDFMELDRRMSEPDLTPDDRDDRTNTSLHDERPERQDRHGRFETPTRREEGSLTRRHNRAMPEVRERGSSFDRYDQGRNAPLTRGARIERRHEPRLTQGITDQVSGVNLVKDVPVRDPFAETSMPQDLHIRRDPNRGHGNLISTEYPEETRKGKKEPDPSSRFSSAQKLKLQADIGSFYCS